MRNLMAENQFYCYTQTQSLEFKLININEIQRLLIIIFETKSFYHNILF